MNRMNFLGASTNLGAAITIPKTTTESVTASVKDAF